MERNERNDIRFQPGLTIEHDQVLMDGKSYGLAVSLGSGYVLYTTEKSIQDLDGKRFESLGSLQLAVEHAIHEFEGPEIAA